MLFTKSHIFICLLSIFCLFGCETYFYSGDGKLIDNGLTAANERYILDLGEINLGSNGEYTYKVSNLPKQNFVFGINVSSESIKDNSFVWDAPINAKIKLNISSNGKTIVQENALAKEWTWSHKSGDSLVFGYRRNNGSAGTYITPNRGASYIVKLKIYETDGTGNKYKSSLLAKSGGWK